MSAPNLTYLLLIVIQLFLHVPHNNAESVDKLNVLFIVIDDLRPSLGCYGGPIISPNVDQLAKQSAVFNNAMVQQSLCAPSRTSFLTGRRPDTTKVYDFGSYWRSSGGNYTTIPQHFKDNGYFTASVGKVFHPGVPSGCNDDYPYSWSIPAYHPSTERFKFAKVCLNLDGTLHNNVMCPVNVEDMPQHTLPDIQAFERADEILRNLSSARVRSNSNDHGDIDTVNLDERRSDLRNSFKGQRGDDFLSNNIQDVETVTQAMMKPPFFLGVGYHKPHVPWKYPKEYESLYPVESVEVASNPNIPKKMPSVAWDDFYSLRLRDDMKALNTSFPYGTIPLNYHASMRQNYYASATYTDYQVGRLLQVLESSGFANNTIILFVGDHGWQLGEHGEWCKFSNFELATRVPLMIHMPGITDTQWSSGNKFTLRDPLDALNDRFTPMRNERSSKRKAKEKTISGIPSKNYMDHLLFSELPARHIEKTSTSDSTFHQGVPIDAFVELVDIFPTLSELAGLDIPPMCPQRSFDVDFCAEGVSFAPLILDSIKGRNLNPSIGVENAGLSGFKRWKNATFSQYPRPGVNPGRHTDVPHIPQITIMGYSMRSSEYHYTEWISFNHTTFTGNWTDVRARELYLNSADPDQNNNVADVAKYKDVVEDLSVKLQRGWRDCLPVNGTYS